MTIHYYSRQGLELPNVVAWAKYYEDVAYRNVAIDADIDAGVMVSTIWEGFDSPPKGGIFEVALIIDGSVRQQWRARTEKEALEVHDDVCMQVFKRHARPEDGHLETVIEREREMQLSQGEKS